jgi:hypothetical protein
MLHSLTYTLYLSPCHSSSYGRKCCVLLQPFTTLFLWHVDRQCISFRSQASFCLFSRVVYRSSWAWASCTKAFLVDLPSLTANAGILHRPMSLQSPSKSFPLQGSWYLSSGTKTSVSYRNTARRHNPESFNSNYNLQVCCMWRRWLPMTDNWM